MTDSEHVLRKGWHGEDTVEKCTAPKSLLNEEHSIQVEWLHY